MLDPKGSITLFAILALTDPLGGRQPYRQSPKGPTMNFFGLNERSW